MKKVTSILEKLSGISTPFFGVSWHPTSHKELDRKLVLLDEVIESYRSVESGIWKAKEHFHQHRLSKDEAVMHIRPITSKASETRDYVRAHQYEWGSLANFINELSVQTLLCFTQLLALRPTIIAPVEHSNDQAPELDDTIRSIGEKLDALSYVVSLYHAVVNGGESCLVGDDLDAFRWLDSISAK